MAKLWGAPFLILPLLFLVPVQAAEMRSSGAPASQAAQARRVVACIAKSVGGRHVRQPDRRAKARVIEMFNRRHDTDLFGKASVSDQIVIPQGSWDYYVISYFEFPGDEAEAIARRAEALEGKFLDPEPMTFSLVRGPQALAYVETPERRKALSDEGLIIARVKACMKASGRQPG